MFLENLTQLSGVSGCEYEVRNFIKDKLNNMNCDYVIDKLGNIIAHNKGKNCGKKVLLAAHMDEVGLMVNHITSEGFIKFSKVGGIDPRVLNSKKVIVGDKKVAGVIGSKAIHLMTASDRKNSVPLSGLYIDIGSKSKEATEKLVEIGDYVSFVSDYIEFGDNMIKSKALDDRIGCSVMLNILDMKLDVDFYCAFTVMEEVGEIGAKVVADTVKPDFAIILEGTVSADMPEINDSKKVTVLGNGPAISVMDATTIYQQDDVDFVTSTADEENIKYQFRRGTAGSNDAGFIGTDLDGCSTVSINTPCRYIHSPVCVCSKDDYENVTKLVKALLLKF